MDDGHGIINYARPPNLPYLDSGLARECINMALGILKACRRLVAGLSKACRGLMHWYVRMRSV